MGIAKSLAEPNKLPFPDFSPTYSRQCLSNCQWQRTRHKRVAGRRGRTHYVVWCWGFVASSATTAWGDLGICGQGLQQATTAASEADDNSGRSPTGPDRTSVTTEVGAHRDNFKCMQDDYRLFACLAFFRMFKLSVGVDVSVTDWLSLLFVSLVTDRWWAQGVYPAGIWLQGVRQAVGKVEAFSHGSSQQLM